jgi:hypothetical protein
LLVDAARTALGAAARAKAAAAPAPARTADRLPSRPLDSRVVSVNFLANGNGTKLPMTAPASAGEPFLITLPFRDLSIVRWDAAAARVAGVDVGQRALAGPS